MSDFLMCLSCVFIGAAEVYIIMDILMQELKDEIKKLQESK